MPKPVQYAAKDGTVTWRVRFRDSSGRSRSRTFMAEQDAQWFADTIAAHGARSALRALHDLEAEGAPDDSPTVHVVFAEWIEWKADYVRSTRTISDYSRQYEDQIGPALGDLPIASVTSSDVGAWIDALVAGRIVSTRTGRRLSPKSIAGRHALLHQIMEYAAHPRRAYIVGNPCAGVDLPKRLRPVPKGLMPAEWQALHTALHQIDPDAADIAAFMLGSGWRWGEACALTPAAIEDYGPAASMWVTMQQVSRRDDEGAYDIAADEGKAQRSMRRIKLDADTAALVRRRLPGLGPSDAVFTAYHRWERKGRVPWSYPMFHRKWQHAVAAANLARQPTPHWLRHTHVAWLAMSGTPLPELQRRIGHASITTTIGTYGSMIGDVNDDALVAFSRMRSSAPPLQIEQ